ncbi:penicillin-binding protein 1C [Vitreoscilla filiformis]|uniref:peptidoglycan glycosyltransferase n=1 Tax=Vitreoscilla filiformis TaxID=63 RepID=A0A221KIR4_VITFI|nr:penicillin-binding protein 1C [Vitreoscilla filiformis]ASM78932.1 penicillin-binding protein 1C [Vitreoscilla filiformis]
MRGSGVTRGGWAAWRHGLVGLGLALLAGGVHADEVPSFAEVKAAYRPSDLPVLDRQGRPLATLRVDERARRLGWVALEDMSPALLSALVHSEDRRFWEHSGVDWSALARSAWRNLFNQRTQGGSTLTMQLAGLLDQELARPRGGRSVGQKLGQMGTAQVIDARWRKADVLEAYLNLVPLRGELVGVNAATQTLFGKHVSGLDAQEAAVLAALVRAPNASAERVATRACELLGSLAGATVATQRGTSASSPVKPPLDLGEQRCRGLPTLTANALARKGVPALGEQLAPHAARLAWRQAQATPTTTPPAALRTTLDADVQRLALSALREQLTALRQREVDDGAVVVLDNTSGAVLAWVGSIGQGAGAPAVDAVQARRQPGSTLKPFVYGLAFERHLLTPASLLHDEPTQLGTGGAGLYLPQNYNKRYQGWVSARVALASSLNIPAVRVGAMLGPEAMFERFNRLGLALSHTAGFHGHALALGTAEVTLADLTNAYRTLANHGRWAPWQLLAPPAARRAPAPYTVMPAAVAWLVADILADNTARALTFGFDSPLVTRGWAAVKTGTSKDMRDNWCIGFTDRYTVGVWVGNANGAPMRHVSGVTGAAPVWRTLVQALHARTPSRAPRSPAGVVTWPLPVAGGEVQPTALLAGTEPRHHLPNAQVKASAHREAFGIRSPVDGSVFALDPDIPPRVQRILLEGAAGEWWLDGKRLGRSTPAGWPWAPWPGHHVLELRDESGQRVLAQVRFEVRGAVVRATARR